MAPFVTPIHNSTALPPRRELGGKAANLLRLFSSGFQVPPAIVVESSAFDLVLLSVREGISNYEERLQEATREPTSEQCAEFCSEVRRLFGEIALPDAITSQIKAGIRCFASPIPLAVRSSATVEDGSRASWAGQFDTVLNVAASLDRVESAVRTVWASSFSPRVLSYAATMEVPFDSLSMAVIIQELVFTPDWSGVLFTRHPAGKPDTFYIETVAGYGTQLVSGETTPDSHTLHIREARLVDCDPPHRALSMDHLSALCDVATGVQSLFGCPQDIEFAFKDDRIYILQSRPIATLSEPQAGDPALELHSVIITGLPASGGVGSGTTRLIFNIDNATKMEDGEVIVAPMTNPDMVPYMSRANAIVTDVGGMICHTAIVAREMGIPCVVGTRDATKRVHSGALVSVDGNTGRVYAGEKGTSVTSSSEDWLSELSHRIRKVKSTSAARKPYDDGFSIIEGESLGAQANLLRVKQSDSYFGHVPEQLYLPFPYPPRDGPIWAEGWRFLWKFPDQGSVLWANIRPEIVNTPLTKSLVVQGIEAIPFILQLPNPEPLYTRWRKCRVHMLPRQLDAVRMALAERLTSTPDGLRSYVDELHGSYSRLDEATAFAQGVLAEEVTVADLIPLLQQLWTIHEDFFALCFLIQTLGDDLIWPTIAGVVRHVCMSVSLPEEAAASMTQLIATPHERTLSSLYLESLDDLWKIRQELAEQDANPLRNKEWQARLQSHLANWGWMRDRDLLYSPLDSEEAVNEVLDRYRAVQRRETAMDQWNEARDVLADFFVTDHLRAKFFHLLDLGVQLHVERENHHVIWVRNVDTIRRILLKIGDELVQRGVLRCIEDVFFLYLPDIFSVLKRGKTIDRRTVANRRKAFFHEAGGCAAKDQEALPQAEADYY